MLYGSVGVLITAIIVWLASQSADYHTTFLQCMLEELNTRAWWSLSINFYDKNN